MSNLLPTTRFKSLAAACRLALAMALTAFVAGCGSVPYYAQAIGGQLEIWRLRVPIDDAINDESVDQETRRRLELVRDARAFAHQALGLPDNGSYRHFADIGREYVVWNVFVAPRFGLEPKQSCFLFAGCFSYRGYFSKSSAEAYAREHRQLGLDVYIGGVSAYSTLGWFDDPVLSTLLHYDDEQLVETLFHELAHEWLYVKGDTSFNESFAVVVAEHGLSTWLRNQGQAPARHSWNRYQQILKMVLAARDQLEVLYGSKYSDGQMSERKASVFRTMHGHYARLKAEWGGYSGYDRWMEQPWNNAKLASVSTYSDWVPYLRAILMQQHQDLMRFGESVADLGQLPSATRQVCLSGFTEQHYSSPCPDRFRVKN